jgi:hypothetical protein
MENTEYTRDFQSERVEVGRSAVRNLNAGAADVDRSAVQRLTAETVVASNSAMGVVNGATIELKDSAAAVVAGDYVRVENGRVFVLLAPRVNGTVHAVITIPAAFALGAGYFVARRLFLSLVSRKSG